MYFLTRRLADSDIRDMQKLIPRRQFVESWRNLEEDAGKLAKRLSGKEAAFYSAMLPYMQAVGAA